MSENNTESLIADGKMYEYLDYANALIPFKGRAYINN